MTTDLEYANANEAIAISFAKGADILNDLGLARENYAEHEDGTDAELDELNVASVCALGAAYLGGLSLDYFEADAIGISQSVLGRGITHFNDDVATTKTMVQTAMRRIAYVAALRARNEKVNV
jgi:hypothetical protein